MQEKTFKGVRYPKVLVFCYSQKKQLVCIDVHPAFPWNNLDVTTKVISEKNQMISTHYSRVRFIPHIYELPV